MSARTTERKYKMHFSLILAGMIFLFSPDISMFDLLPDVVGWFLITLGMGRLSDIEMRAEDAKQSAKRMMLFSAVKLVISVFSLKFSSSDLLLAAFCYGIVEIITVIPFVNNLFMSIDYTAMRVGTSLDSDRMNSAKWYLYVFFAVKNVLAILPATVSIFDSSLTGEYSANTWFIDFAALMRTLMLLAFFVSLVMTVVMLVYFIPFWRRLIRNRDLNVKLLDHRRVTVLNVPARMVKKNTSFVLAMFMPAVIFFFDFYLDGIDVLPTFLGFALIMVGGMYAKKHMGFNCIALIAVASFGTVVSFTAFIYRLLPLIRNKFVMDYNFSAKPYTLPLASLTSLLTAVIFVLLYRTAGEFNKKYTKYKLEDSLVLYMLGGVILAGFDFALYAYPRYNTTFVFPSIFFGILFCALGTYYFAKLRRQIKHDNKD